MRYERHPILAPCLNAGVINARSSSVNIHGESYFTDNTGQIGGETSKTYHGIIVLHNDFGGIDIRSCGVIAPERGEVITVYGRRLQLFIQITGVCHKGVRQVLHHCRSTTSSISAGKASKPEFSATKSPCDSASKRVHKHFCLPKAFSMLGNAADRIKGFVLSIMGVGATP